MFERNGEGDLGFTKIKIFVFIIFDLFPSEFCKDDTI